MLLTNKNKNYIMVRYEDLNEEKQAEIDVILQERAEEQVQGEVEEGHIDQEYAEDRLEQLMSEWTDEIWMELEV